MALPEFPDRLRKLVRPQVRAEHAYHVGAVDSIDVKLNQNESPFDLPVDLKKDLLARFSAIPFNRYPAEQPDALVGALAEREGLPPGSVLVGNGSNELTYTLGLCYVREGQPVVLPRPMFALYQTMVGLHGGVAVEVASLRDFSFDVESIVHAVRQHQPALTVLATPNNPSGRALPLAAIAKVAEASPGMLLVDEAYVEFNPHGSAKDLLETYPNILILRTLSKAFGLAGLRVGFMLGHPEVMQELLKARLPFMVDRLAETAALFCLEHGDLVRARVQKIQAGRELLFRALTDLPGVEVLPSDTNFLLFQTDIGAERVMEEMAKAGILLRNMGGYPELRGYVRVTAGTDAENTRFLVALKRVLSKTD